MFKSKIHRATVTGADLNYMGSITIDENLMDKADIIESEKVLVLNINNGARFETYATAGKRGHGEICLNGAAARCAEVGDMVIIVSFAVYTPEELDGFKSIVVHVDKNNKPV